MFNIKEKLYNSWIWLKAKTKQILIGLGVIGVATASAGGAVLDQQANPYEKISDKFEIQLPEQVRISVSENKPELYLSKWDDECFIKVGLPTQSNNKVKRKLFTNKLEWQDGNNKIQMYPIEKKIEKIENVIMDNNINNSMIRYIPLGKTDAITIMAEYELFNEKEPEELIITSYRPMQEVLVLWGHSSLEKFFNIQDIQIPIIRYSTKKYALPMYINSDVSIVDFHFNEKLYNQRNIRNTLNDAVIDVFKKHDITIVKGTRNDWLYYTKNDIKYKFLSSAFDTNKFIFYINFGAKIDRPDFIKSEYLKKISSGFLSPVVKFGTKLGVDVSIGTLWDIDKNLNPDTITSEIVYEFTNKFRKDIIIDNFTDKEKQTISQLSSILSSKEWHLEEKRPIDPNKIVVPEIINGFEYEIILKEKLESNIIELLIESKGLKFFYQPPLHPDHPTWVDSSDNGLPDTFRPENVVGSYAVYHESKTDHIIGQKNYRAGKAFHIYRPKIIDSAGTEVWGKLNIDIEKGILSVEIPQEFLDNAVYPVRHAAGLEFGYIGEGQSHSTDETAYNNRILFASATGAVGTGVSMSAYGSAPLSGTSGRMCLYDASLNKITNGQTDEDTNVTTSLDWITLNFTSSPTLSAQTYHLAYWGDGDGPVYDPYTFIYYDSGQDSWEDIVDGPYGTFPASITKDNTHTDKKFSIYCTYTAGGGEEEDKQDIFWFE